MFTAEQRLFLHFKPLANCSKTVHMWNTTYFSIKKPKHYGVSISPLHSCINRKNLQQNKKRRQPWL